MKRLEGYEAIEYARNKGLLLSKYGDPIESFRPDVSPDEAEDIARQDAQLIYLDIEE